MEGTKEQRCRKDLGLALLRTAATIGASAETIACIRNGCAEDGVPEHDVDAAWEEGYRAFDASRTATSSAAP